MKSLQVISGEHANLWRLATSLTQLADDIDGGAAVDVPFFELVFDYIDRFVDKSHHLKEDDFLFRLMRLRSERAAELLERFSTEHQEVPARLAGLRRLLPGASSGAAGAAAFTEALRAYLEELEAHIRDEERAVLPLAKNVLVPSDWDEIDAAFLDAANPAFGQEATERLRDLFHRIASLAPESVGLGASSAGSFPASARARPTGEVLLEVTGLESHYGRIKVLKAMDIVVRKGETVALVGANGAGKTTFMRTLSGVQPLSAGRIVFKGEDISRLRADLRVRRGICQSPEGRQVFGPLSIEDNLRLGAFTQSRHLVDDDLERVFSVFPVLKEKRSLPAGTLSGGQQQMLAIGRALMGRPSLLLLDEPSMGLAPMLG